MFYSNRLIFHHFTAMLYPDYRCLYALNRLAFHGFPFFIKIVYKIDRLLKLHQVHFYFKLNYTR